MDGRIVRKATLLDRQSKMKLEPPEQDSASILPDPDTDQPSGSTPNPSAKGAPNPQAMRKRKRIIIWLFLFILIGVPAAGFGGYGMLWSLATGMIMEATGVFWFLSVACFSVFVGTLLMVIDAFSRKS